MNLSLHEKALLTVKKYKRCKTELIHILEQIDKDKTYLAFGKSSLFRYCVELLNLSESDTYRFIQVTRKGTELPLFKQAVSTGVITIAEASRIAPVITLTNQSQWIEKAKELTCRELEREVAKEKPKAIIPERLKVLTADKSELRMSISKELEGKLRRAQEVFRTRDLEETLEIVLELALKQKDPVEKARRNSMKTPVTASAKNISNITRTIPQHIRHQVFVRDEGRCTFKNCGETKWIEVHHRLPLSQGGTHSLLNLVTLCQSHHRLLHR